MLFDLNVVNANFGKIADVLPYFSRSALGENQDTDHAVEVRLTSPRTDKLKWMIGGSYFSLRNTFITNAFGIAGFSVANPQGLANSDTYGLFASATYDLGAGFAITGEGRIQWDKVFQQTLAGINPSGQATFRSASPRVILDYKPSKDLTVYASYSQGTRPGEFNTAFLSLSPAFQAQVLAVTAAPLVVPEEKIKMGELGVKGMFLDERLRVLADVYYGRWTNRHIPNLVSLLNPNGSLSQTLTVQAPGGIIRLSGFELEGAFKATKELTLEATFNIAATSIRNTFCTDCRLITGNPTPVGTQLPYYPKTKGTFSATYERQITDELLGFIRGDVIYTGKIFDSEANIAWLAPSTRMNLRLGVQRGKTSLEVYGNNVTDNRTPSSLARNTDSLTGTNAISVSLADKATYGVRFKTQF